MFLMFYLLDIGIKVVKGSGIATFGHVQPLVFPF